MRNYFSILLLFLSNTLHSEDLSNFYIYPPLYPFVTDAFLCRDPGGPDHINTFVETKAYKDEDTNKVDPATLEYKVDLNADGYCEYFIYPPIPYIGNSGGWYDIYQYKDKRYIQIGTTSDFGLVFYTMKNGYVRIGHTRNVGSKSSWIYVTKVISFDGEKYVNDSDKEIYTTGYYRDIGVKNYKKNDLKSAEIIFQNMYRANGEKNLSDANDLALVLIKQGRCNEAINLLDKHLNNITTEKENFINAAKFNRKLCEKNS